MLHLFFLFMLFFLTPSTFANDAVEAASAGSIVFIKTPELVIQDETLSITKSNSTRFGEEQFSVDVDFHIKNTSKNDITRKLAFALPPVICQEDINTMWQGLDETQDHINNKGFKDFTVVVDGKSVNYTKRQEAMLNNENITDLLIKLKIPLNPCQIQMGKDNKPDPKYRANLEKNQLLNETNAPAWSENIYFEWDQTFPAGKVINIHHHYTPMIGQSVPAKYALNDLSVWFTETTPPLTPIWSRDPSTLIKSNPNIVSKNTTYQNDPRTRLCVVPTWVRYRLTTGANWDGGIGVFKLVITDDNGAPFAVNQFYQTDPNVGFSQTRNTMTFIAKNFIPKEDLLVLFLSLPQDPKDFDTCALGS